MKQETRIFLDGVDVTAVTKSFWPDDGVIEVLVDGAVVRKYGRVEVRTVDVAVESYERLMLKPIKKSGSLV